GSRRPARSTPRPPGGSGTTSSPPSPRSCANRLPDPQRAHSLSESSTHYERKAAMAEFLYRVGRWCARRAWTVITAWAVLLAAAAGAFALFGGTLSNAFSIPGTPTEEVTEHLQEAMPEASGGTGGIVLSTSDGEPFTDEQQAAISDLAAEAARTDGVETVVDPFATEAERTEQEQLLAGGLAEIETGREQLEAGLAPLEDARQELTEAQEQLDAAREQAEDAGQAEAMAEQFEAQQAEIDAGLAELEAQQAQLAARSEERPDGASGADG